MISSLKWQQFSCLHPKIVNTLLKQGYYNPTSIQSQVYQNYQHYYDFLIASQTGSGKTLAFAAPIVSDLINLQQRIRIGNIQQQQQKYENKSAFNNILCLVMTPTRQLALQIQQVFQILIKQTDIKKVCILGGLSVAKQLRVLRQIKPQILIGTPGRINQLLNENQLSFNMLKFLVVDQADRMIQMGHYRQLDNIFNKIFMPQIKQIYEDDYQQIVKKMQEQTEKSQFWIVKNGKKKKVKFNINSLQTQKLIQVPMDLFAIDGDIQQNVQPINENKKKKQKNNNKQTKMNNNQLNEQPQKQAQKMLQSNSAQHLIQKMRRRVFFVSATLTKQFKGSKYFVKKNQSLDLQNQTKSSKSKSKQKKKDSSKDGSNKQNQYILKLKALLSRVKFDSKPKIIDQSSTIFLPEKLKQKYCFCKDDIDKMTTILCYINELPENSKIIIFTNTIRASKRIKFFTDGLGLKSVSLHSHMMQKQRLQKLERFQKSKSNILISTDVAARGLDFVITNVIQYSVPINGDTYVHRVGRTARAQRSGQALVLISEKQSTNWQQISQMLQTNDSERKVQKYCPIQSSYNSTKQRVQQYEWIRINQQKQENKRMDKINQMQAQQFGLQVQESIQKHKNKNIVAEQEQERLHKQKIQKQVTMIKNKNKIQDKMKGNKNSVEIGDGKIWKKNKLVLSLDQMKKFL